MRFFYPFTVGEDQAERVYQRLINRLRELGYELAPYRVYKLVQHQEGKVIQKTVGDNADNGEIVLAIFRDGHHYLVCTPNCGVIQGLPIPILATQVDTVELFDSSIR